MQKHAKTIQSKLATPFKIEASSSSAFRSRGAKRTDEIVSKEPRSTGTNLERSSKTRLLPWCRHTDHGTQIRIACCYSSSVELNGFLAIVQYKKFILSTCAPFRRATFVKKDNRHLTIVERVNSCLALSMRLPSLQETRQPAIP